MPRRNFVPPGRKLVGNLTVADARHLLHAEGGELTAAGVASRVVSILAVAGLTARAIVVGDATAWHLALPMAAQYLAIVAALPLLYLVTPHAALRGEAIKSLWLWVALAAAGAGAALVRSRLAGTSWSGQISADATAAWRWISEAKMQWPVLAAMIAEAAALPGRVRHLVEHGPPFVGVSLGCAMRVAVLALGVFLLPWAMTSAARAAWTLWGLVLVAELLAVAMHLDVQRQLRKVEEDR